MLVLVGSTAVIIVAIAALAVFSTTGGRKAKSFTPNYEGLIPVGEKAPSFTAETVDGGSVSHGASGALAPMLVFFATWCPHCQREIPVTSERESQYDGLQLVMVSIDGQDNPAKVQQCVERYNIEGPTVYEPSLGSEYGVSGYPTVYVLNGDDEVIGAPSGPRPREAYKGWIEKALGSSG